MLFPSEAEFDFNLRREGIISFLVVMEMRCLLLNGTMKRGVRRTNESEWRIVQLTFMWDLGEKTLFSFISNSDLHIYGYMFSIMFILL